MLCFLHRCSTFTSNKLRKFLAWHTRVTSMRKLLKYCRMIKLGDKSFLSFPCLPLYLFTSVHYSVQSILSLFAFSQTLDFSEIYRAISCHLLQTKIDKSQLFYISLSLDDLGEKDDVWFSCHGTRWQCFPSIFCKLVLFTHCLFHSTAFNFANMRVIWLCLPLIREMCVRFADLERKLGEIDRARAIYMHASQLADPRVRVYKQGLNGALRMSFVI